MPSALTRIVMDVIALMAIGFFYFGLTFGVDPTVRPFYCDDRTIRQEFRNSTIPNWALILLAMVFPMIMIFFTEIIIGAFSSMRNHYDISFFCFRYNISYTLYSAYSNLMQYALGGAGVILITAIGKITVGRLRPHFFNRCQPVNLDCPVNSTKLITSYECANPNFDEVKETRLSFPSGHASSMFYGMVFLSLYLKDLNRRHRYSSVVLMMQALLLSLATFVALTRYIDHKHHPTDILTGTILGVAFGFIVAYRLRRNIDTIWNNGDDKTGSQSIPMTNKN
ncbi:hypothetical protein SNEBB_000223 [Seison nebaliae]|nr:hypothetical protein SNEBB_000223 [Seison nebaliae]